MTTGRDVAYEHARSAKVAVFAQLEDMFSKDEAFVYTTLGQAQGVGNGENTRADPSEKRMGTVCLRAAEEVVHPSHIKS